MNAMYLFKNVTGARNFDISVSGTVVSTHDGIIRTDNEAVAEYFRRRNDFLELTDIHNPATKQKLKIVRGAKSTIEEGEKE